ncbi:MAG TPA: NAD(P)/FAD-dependent oxidoreductase [Ilumatobacteraceae bacterium]
MTESVTSDVVGAVEVDALVVGAGFAGIYSIYALRRAGFTVHAVEAGDGVGGTWYWNRYPGARCDTPSLEYSFGFSPELDQEWSWTEYFAGQPEIERYLNHITDRFDLRRHIEFGTRVTAATWDAQAFRWRVVTSTGHAFAARWVVMATGCLSAPIEPDLPGLDRFGGTVLRTSNWPADADIRGLRVAVIGTGSSAVQTVPELARDAAHLHVFQRSGAFTWPSNNGPMDPAVLAAAKRDYPYLRRRQRLVNNGIVGFGGATMFQAPRPIKIRESTEQDRRAAVEQFGWGACRAWSDVTTDADANEIAVEMYRDMIRATVDDADTAEKLTPRGYPLGCKRPILDTGYFETFNRPNVTIVDLQRGGIEEITRTGIRTAQGDFEFDVIVLATGFDAMTGALDRIDIAGRDGRVLRDEWRRAGARTLLGLLVEGFPNLFMITGPGSPSVVANMAAGIEQHVDWITECARHLRDNGLHAIETTLEAQDDWVDEVNRAASGTMYVAPSCNSWYVGTNVPGKPRVFLPYVGGFDKYVRRCEEIAQSGYADCHLS